MNKSPGIIYLQEMQCDICGTVIQIKEKEETTVIVNAQGLPINSDVTNFSVKGICPKCGKEFDVEKNGMYFTLRNKTFECCPHLRTKGFEKVRFEFGVEI